MFTRICCLISLLCAAVLALAQVSYVAPAYPDVLAGKAPLRMLVASHQPLLAWKGAADITVTDAAKKLVTTVKPGEQAGMAVNADGKLWLRKGTASLCAATKTLRLQSKQAISLLAKTPDVWVALNGPVYLTPLADGTCSAAVELPLEDYLRDVLPGEVAPYFYPQMMRAQAVVARTYALCKLGRHADEGADICAYDHCQVFSFADKRTKTTEDAVAATKGLILLYRGKLTEPYYSSCCGGISDDAGYVWGPEYARPYLTGVADFATKKPAEEITLADIFGLKTAYCSAAKSFRWERRYTAAEVNALVAKNLPVVTGDPAVKMKAVSNLSIEERTPFGRVSSLRVEGDGASVLVYGDAARWLFGDGQPGPSGLWSALFDITITRDKAGAPVGYRIRGAGRGHGIGLCQWGADGRARAGQTFRQILHAYYPGTRLSDEKK